MSIFIPTSFSKVTDVIAGWLLFHVAWSQRPQHGIVFQYSLFLA